MSSPMKKPTKKELTIKTKTPKGLTLMDLLAHERVVPTTPRKNMDPKPDPFRPDTTTEQPHGPRSLTYNPAKNPFENSVMSPDSDSWFGFVNAVTTPNDGKPTAPIVFV